MTTRKLDWKPRHDPRNDRYPVTALFATSPAEKRQDARLADLEKRVTALEHNVPPTPPPPVPPAPPGPQPASWVVWTEGPNLDQGAEGECVGFGWADALAAAPHPRTLNLAPGEASDPERIYVQAQKNDGQPADEQSGTSVLGGAQAVKQFGWVSSYYWCKSVAEIATTVRTISPVVIGIPWTQDMFHPDASGLVHATGAVAGGHCLVVIGVNADGSTFRLRNSWSQSWGVNGDCLISANDLASLFTQSGEACVGVKA